MFYRQCLHLNKILTINDKNNNSYFFGINMEENMNNIKNNLKIEVNFSMKVQQNFQFVIIVKQ